MAIALVVVMACSSATPQPGSSPSASGKAEALITLSPTASPAPSTPASASARVASLTGDWIYLLNKVDAPICEEHEVWAVRPDGTSAHRILHYVPLTSCPLGGFGIGRTDLRRQLSPDGRTLLLTMELAANSTGAVHPGIGAVDVVSGRVTPLSPDPAWVELEPSWSPDGREIAFTRVPAGGRDRQLWTMHADGARRRRLPTGANGLLFGFTPDGRFVCFWDAGYACLDLASGDVRRFSGDLQPGGNWTVSAGSWRTASPRFVGAFIDASPRIDVADAPGSGQRTIARAFASDPRWRPGSDEILYQSRTDLWLVALGGDPRQISAGLAVGRAEWSPDGDQIFAVVADTAQAPPAEATPPPPPGTSLKRISLDGSVTEVFRPPAVRAAAGLVELTVFRYP